MTTNEAIKIVAKFEGWRESGPFIVGKGWSWSWRSKDGMSATLPDYLHDRNATIEAAKKLPEDWQLEFARKIAAESPSFELYKLWLYLVTVKPETMLLALAETITEMKGEK